MAYGNYFVLILVLILLAGCGQAVAPTPDLLATEAGAGETAAPTATTERPTPTDTPTSTPAPPTATSTPTAEPTPYARYNAPGDHLVDVVSGSQNRSFMLHVPPNYEPGVPLPLVINLHGRGSNAFEQEHLSQMSAKADEEGFIVVYPEALGVPSTWYAGGGAEAIADVIFLRDLIYFLEERMGIDADRVYATGFSNGGGMANRLGCALADKLAAIASVSGAYTMEETCRPIRPLPVLAFHGTSDNFVPYDGGGFWANIHDWAAAWADRNGCDPSPTVTYREGDVIGETWANCDMDAAVILYTIEGGGHVWPGSGLGALVDEGDQGISATDLIWDFFEAHSLP